MPVCKCFTISYNDHRWIWWEDWPKKEKRKKKSQWQHPALWSQTETNMCWIQWAKDVFSSEVTPSQDEIPYTSIAQKTRSKRRTVLLESFPLETGSQKGGEVVWGIFLSSLQEFQHYFMLFSFKNGLVHKSFMSNLGIFCKAIQNIQ